MERHQEGRQRPSPSPPGLPRRLVRFALTVTVILVVLHAYIGWQLLPALPLGQTGSILGAASLALSALMIPLGLLARFLFSRQELADRIAWAGSLAMGLFSSLLALTLLRQAVVAALATPRIVVGTAVLVPALAALITLIGFVNARRLPRVVAVDIPLAGLPQALIGFTIVQISDIHVGPTIKGDFVAAIVDCANALDADLIAVTGDVVDGSVARLASHTAPLARLACRHGCYFVTGNHEYYSGAEEWIGEFRRLGLHCLMNQHVVLSHDGARLVLAGVTDYSAHLFDPAQRSDPMAALAGAPEEAAVRVLLAHQPRSADAAADAGFDLQLSGHTHGGQFWPWIHLVRLQQPYTAGLHRHGRLWVYTSRGSGYWGPPKRFGAPAEITRLRLVAAR